MGARGGTTHRPGEPAFARSSRDAKTFGDLIKLHREDLQEVGKRIGRSKAVSMTFLGDRLGRLRIPELDRGRLMQFGKERAREDAAPSPSELIWDTSRPSCRTRRQSTASYSRSSPFFWLALRSHGLVSLGRGMSATDHRRRMNWIVWLPFSREIAFRKFRSGGSSDSLSRPRCVRTKSAG